MVTFGFSAFLKLLSLNERPRRTALRQRLSPSAGGYDFHRSFRLHARRLLVDGVAVDDVLTSAGTITKLPERRSAVAALQRLDLWRRSAPGPVFQGEPVIYESPRRLFRVRFEPDFSIRLHGHRTAFHIWNTMRPNLTPGVTYAALSLVAQAYEDQDDAPDDVAVLSVREPLAVYLFSNSPDPSTVASSIVDQLEDAIGGSDGPPSAPEDRPTPA